MNERILSRVSKAVERKALAQGENMTDANGNVTIVKHANYYQLMVTVYVATTPFLFQSIEEFRGMSKVTHIARSIAERMRLHEVRIVDGNKMTKIEV